MKAWLLDDLRGVEHLRLGDVRDPVAGEGEVVVDLEYAALNPADAHVARGQYPGKPEFPHVLGRDGIGVISSVGAHADPFRVGQRVLIIRGETGVSRWGTFAQRVAVSVQSITVPPAGWTEKESAGAALVYLTAYQALTQWGELPASVVLVTGASGGVGIAAIQLAKVMGHTVVALSRGTGKHEKLKEIGADYVIDSVDSDWSKKLKQILAPGKVDLAIDNIGGAMFPEVVATLGYAGRISVVGQVTGPVPQFSTATLFFRRLRIGGVAVGTFTPAEARQAWEVVVGLLAKSGARPVIDRVFPFEWLLAAFGRLAAGPVGKVLIEIPK